MSTFSPVQWCLKASVDVPAMETADDWLANWRQLPLDELSPLLSVPAVGVVLVLHGTGIGWWFEEGMF